MNLQNIISYFFIQLSLMVAAFLGLRFKIYLFIENVHNSKRIPVTMFPNVEELAVVVVEYRDIACEILEFG